MLRPGLTVALVTLVLDQLTKWAALATLGVASQPISTGGISGSWGMVVSFEGCVCIPAVESSLG